MTRQAKIERHLKALNKLWKNEKDLWLWAADGTLILMRKSLSEKGDGMRKITQCSSGSVDPKAVISVYPDITSDGGDW